MSTVEFLYLVLVVGSALAFIGTLAYVAHQTENHLKNAQRVPAARQDLPVRQGYGSVSAQGSR